MLIFGNVANFMHILIYQKSSDAGPTNNSGDQKPICTEAK